MGRLQNGSWVFADLLPEKGDFKRVEQPFRESIRPGSAHPPEAGRYHLYVSYACPWAHRTLIFRELKQLQDLVSVSVVSPDMLENGWTFEQNFPGTTPDGVMGKKFLYEVYAAASPEFTGEVTVPVLFDKKNGQIVNSESSEIIRIFNSAFNDLTGDEQDFYPESLRAEINAVNEDIYKNINNGVYLAGFAREQADYEKAVNALFSALERVENRLSTREYLVGGRLTEADVRLFTTLVRFDPVYHGHFKCNLRMIRHYKNLANYLARLFALEGFGSTTRFDHIQRHYYFSHTQLNPTQIVPAGPAPLVASGKNNRVSAA